MFSYKLSQNKLKNTNEIRNNQLLLFACCFIILIGMVCLIKEHPFVSKEEVIKSISLA